MTELTKFASDHSLSIREALSAKTVEESLLDERSLLEKRLKAQLSLPAEDVDQAFVKQLITQLLEDFSNNDSGLSDNTLSTLFIYWNVFEQWCHQHQLVALPASSETFIRYINDKKSLVKMNTLSQYRWAVS